MPCDQVILCKVDLREAMNNDQIVNDALSGIAERVTKIGPRHYRFSIDGATCELRNGELTVPRGYEYIGDRIKQAYSVKTVQAATRRYGWKVEQKSPTKFVVSKRS